MIFAPPVGVQQINVGLPVNIEGFYPFGDVRDAGEFFVVLVNLVFHPSQVLDGFALARIEGLYQVFSFAIALGQGSTAGSLIDYSAITGRVRKGREVESF